MPTSDDSSETPAEGPGEPPAETPKNPEARQKPIYNPPEVGDRLFLVGIVFFMVFLVCAAFMLLAGKEYKALAIVVSSLWVIGVPIFFFFEHVVIYRKWGDPGEFDQFKRLQDTAAKIWAAAVLVLAALLAHGEKATPPPCCVVPTQSSTIAPTQ